MAIKMWLLTIVLSVTPLTAMCGIGASVNYDPKTTAAIGAAFEAQQILEDANLTSLDSISKSYTRASVALAGIWYTKRLEYRALTHPGIFGSDETRHYQRIKELVAYKIIPKIYSVTGLCLEHPHQAYIWGPYIYKICNDIYQYCMEYECLVTNGQLSFRDINFPKFKEELEELFNLEKFGNIDWKSLVTCFSDFNVKDLGGYNPDSLKSIFSGDLDKVAQVGEDILRSGGNALDSAWANRTAIGQIFSSKKDTMMQAVQKFAGVYQMFQDSMNVKSILSRVTSTIDSSSVMNLFKFRPYNIDSFKINYTPQAEEEQFYRQRYAIVNKAVSRYETTTEVVCDYSPNRKNLQGEWVTVGGSPREIDKERALRISGSYSGWPLEFVQELNNKFDLTSPVESDHDQYNYITELVSIGFVAGNWIAYKIRVEKTHYNVLTQGQTVYEKVLDTKNTKREVFLKDISLKLAEFQANDPNGKYEIVKDEPIYYISTSEKQMKGVYSVSFIANCKDGTTLGEGSFTTKVSWHHSPLNEDSKRYVMRTSISDSNTDLQDADNKIQEMKTQVYSLKNQIALLEDEINEMYVQKNLGNTRISYEDIRKKNNELSKLKEELSQLEADLKALQQARDEMYQEYANEEDDYDGIPSIMRNYELMYGLQWEDAGSWSGYTFTRKAYMPNARAHVKFVAKLSKVRGEKWFLFIRIGRSILKVDYQLLSEVESSDVIETMQLSSSMSDKVRADKVNEKMYELMEEYPNCTINVEYETPRTIEEEAEDYTVHMLWYSDRLRLAIEIEQRLTKIYSQLVLCEKWLHTNRSLKKYLVSKALEPLARSRRTTFTNKSLNGWLLAARMGSGVSTGYEQEEEKEKGK